jgi:uncharacterized protein (DUF1697 family)
VAKQVVLLRGVNLAGRNRVAMGELRELLTDGGFADVRTHLQSGNVLLSSTRSPARVGREVERVLAAALGLELAVIVRTRDELARIVERNPLKRVATDPKRYQVTFLAEKLPESVVRELRALAVAKEKLVADGRELYAWHPEGVARSKLWARLAGRDLGVAATSRNWTTVTRLLALADEE